MNDVKFGSSKRENLDKLLLPMQPAGLSEQQKRDRVKNPLTEMRVKDQTIICEGRGPAAIWKLAS